MMIRMERPTEDRLQLEEQLAASRPPGEVVGVAVTVTRSTLPWARFI